MLVVPVLSLIASLNAVRSDIEDIAVVFIVAELVPLPITKPTLPAPLNPTISAFVTAVASTPVDSVFPFTEDANVAALAPAATVTSP